MELNTLRYWGTIGREIYLLELFWGTKNPHEIDLVRSYEDDVFDALDTYSCYYELNGSAEDFVNSIIDSMYEIDQDAVGGIILGGVHLYLELAKAALDKGNNSAYQGNLRKASDILDFLPPYLTNDANALYTIIGQYAGMSCDQCMINIYPTLNGSTVDSGYAPTEEYEDDGYDDYTTEEDYDAPAPSGTSYIAPTKGKYVFISYSTKDRKDAENIAAYLRNNGVEVWMAPDSIPGGSDYTEMIYDAIDNCATMLLLLTDSSQQSKWVPKEMDLAITLDKTIIPIHLDSSEILKTFYFRLTNAQVIDASINKREALAKALIALKRFL